MNNRHSSAVLDQMLEPVSHCFNPDAAHALIGLRFDKAVESRVSELAEKCNQGQLTAEERSEYEGYIHASTLIGILQAKARRMLAKAGAA